MAKHPTGDVIVLLPGILGSVLERDGKEVWAPTPGAAWRALRSLGRSVKHLKLTDDPIDVDVLPDGVVATRLVPDVHLVPGLWSIDGYTGIRNMILANFDLKPGHFVEFPYDWRRDLRVAARQLGERLQPVLDDDPDARLVLVGHSLGGLVARYFLECLEGWKHARMLVTFGTPYRGAVNALDFIANGFMKKVGPLKVADLSDLVRSCTSVYQLLPIYPCIDAGGNAAVRPAEASGVPHLDTVRARAALTDFHRAIETAVGCRPQNAYTVHPVVGITQETRQSAKLAASVLSSLLTRQRDGEDVDESGDGTVPRVSATPIELGDEPNAVYASQKHACLQGVESVQTQLLGVLTEIPHLGSIRDLRLGLSLTVDDAFEAGEPVPVQVVADPRLELAATVTDLGTGRSERPYPLTGKGRTYAVELRPRPPGDYRVTIAGTGKSQQLVQPVSDVFLVSPEDPESEE